MCVAWLAQLGCGGSGAQDTGTTGEVAGVEIELVGPGVISTEMPEFASALSPDGDTIYFNRTTPDRSSIALFIAIRTESGWSEARQFPPTQGLVAIDPFLSADGRRLYFAAPRVRDGSNSEALSIWFIERTQVGWSGLMDIGAPINSDSVDYFISFTTDGTLAAFSSTRHGTLGLYLSRRSPEGWEDPELLMLEGVTNPSNPLIGPSGDFLIISATAANGSSDLLVACRIAAGWSRPRRLPEPVNSPFAEFAPAIAGEFLYFTSERPGIVGPQPDSIRPPGDLYRTHLGILSDTCPP